MEHELLELERQFWVKASGALYREHMADDGIMVFAAGILDKAQTIETIERASPWNEVTMSGVHVVELADDVAALVYDAEGRRRDNEPYRARAGSVYVRRNRTWLLALHQQTPLS